MTCSTIIGDLEDRIYDSGALALSAGTDQSLAVTPVGSDTFVVVAGWVAHRSATIVNNDPPAEEPVVSNGWTQFSGHRSNNGHAVSAGAYIADTTPPNFNVDWTPTGGGNQGYTRLVAVSVPTTETTPVQTAEAKNSQALVFASTPTEGNLLLLFRAKEVTTGGSYPAAPTGYSVIAEGATTAESGTHEKWRLFAKCAGASESTTVHTAGVNDDMSWAMEWEIVPDVHVSIVATPTTGTAILAVGFDSTVTGGTPTAYAWDFDNGAVSTLADPMTVYTEPGVYDVVLVVTVDGDDYEATVTITVDADFDPPSPGRAILEIKASDPGAARWDLDNWDEAVWSSASWQDVTPYGVEVFITWGSSRPEFGILSTPDACTWSITFYDPERVLDPANADSPYFGDLEPLLPVRLRLESGQIIKQGFVESMSHRFEDDSGYWRVMDIQALLANAVVPSDTTLSDTLFARARDVIAAAGLSITVAPDPPGGDPATTAWETGHEATAWQWISDAAQQVLWVPYVRNDNTLGFRDYRNPYNRSRVIGSPNLVDLQSLTMHNGLFSIVTAGVETRELTPKPRYGARSYERDGIVDGTTPFDDVWAQTVLDDRAVAGLRWVPGRVVPFTSAEVKYFAELEAIEQVAIQYPEASPPISTDGVIVGGEIRVRGKKDDDAIWDFLYHVAQIPTQPLVDDLDAESYLVRDDDPTEYLYPDA